MTRPAFDPQFVNFDAYAAAIYTPPPQLVAIAAVDPFWRTMGGNGWGFDGEIERQRRVCRNQADSFQQQETL